MKEKFIFLMGILIFLSSLEGYSQNDDSITLTLNDAIEIALEKSHTMKNLRLSVIRARENIISAKGQFRTQASMNFNLPDFSESLSGIEQAGGFKMYNTRGTYNFSGNLSVVQPLPTNGEIRLTSSFNHLTEAYWRPSLNDTTTKRFLSSLSISFHQPLFTINNLKYGLKKAKLNFEQANRSIDITKLDLIYNVKSRFYSVFKAQRAAEIAQEQLELQEQSYQLAQKKYKAGLIPEVEVLQMDVDYAECQNAYYEAQGSLKRQLDAFNQFIGLNPGVKISIKNDISFKPVEIDSQRAIEEGVRNRFEIREKMIAIELAKMQLRETQSQGQIRGDLYAFYDLSGISLDNLQDTGLQSLINSSLSDMRDRPQNRGFRLSLTVPLWDWGVNQAEVNAARTYVQSAEYDLEDQRATILREISSAIDEISENKNRLHIAQRRADIAQRSYTISLHRFENGDITSQELALEQQRLASAKRDYLDVLIDYKLAVSDLTRKTMYDFERQERLIK